MSCFLAFSTVRMSSMGIEVDMSVRVDVDLCFEKVFRCCVGEDETKPMLVSQLGREACFFATKSILEYQHVKL